MTAERSWAGQSVVTGRALERAFGSIATFSESYPIALRVTITGVRGFYVRGSGS